MIQREEEDKGGAKKNRKEMSVQTVQIVIVEKKTFWRTVRKSVTAVYLLVVRMCARCVNAGE